MTAPADNVLVVEDRRQTNTRLPCDLVAAIDTRRSALGLSRDEWNRRALLGVFASTNGDPVQVTARRTVGRHPPFGVVPSAHGRRASGVDDPETLAFVAAVERSRRDGKPVVRSLVRDGPTPDAAVSPDPADPLTPPALGLDG